jgi:hypothetical protein
MGNNKRVCKRSAGNHTASNTKVRKIHNEEPLQSLLNSANNMEKLGTWSTHRGDGKFRQSFSR